MIMRIAAFLLHWLRRDQRRYCDACAAVTWARRRGGWFFCMECKARL